VKISCPACQAKYSIADEKVTDRLAKIRCRKCGATIVIDGKATPANVYTASGEAPDSSAAGVDADGGSQYSVDFGEGDQRNLTVAEIITAYNAGQITAETYLWADGFADWKALGEVEEIVEALHSSASAPAVAASGTATPSPWAAPAVTAPRAAARPARGAAADLFGGIEQAGSEDEVTTSAAEHAGGARQSAPSAIGGSSTGARNESSVLFSLSALTSASSPVAASRPSARPMTSAASRDDSGLIDLKALTAAATKNEATASAPLAAPIGVAPPLGLASPLGMASPLGGGFTASAQAGGYPSGGKGKAPLFIGGGFVLAALIIAGAIALKPQPPPPPPAPVVVAPTPAAPAPVPEPVVTATPPATGTAEEPAAKAPPAAPRRPIGGGGGTAPRKPPAAASDPGPAAPAAAPKPKRSACGCAPGDLMCNMQCSAK